MMLLDSLVYLPDDILVKVDRASMAVSLEARGPLLDYRLFEFAWRVPTEFKVRDGKTKFILRDLLSRYVPREIIERPKSGFAVPVAQWLRGPLRAWAEDLLAESRIAREGFLDPAAVRQTWSEHQSGRDWSSRLWAVLMFESWLEATETAPSISSQTSHHVR
jgi:asparagine synthase (glutamine-hydrolysing)